jgi:hypothetical protein
LLSLIVWCINLYFNISFLLNLHYL